MTDSIVVVAVGPAMILPPGSDASALPLIQVTARRSSGGPDVLFNDLASNAALYTLGAEFTLTIAPKATV